MPATLCPTLFNTGSCAAPDCSFNHSSLFCDLCGVSCPTKTHLQSHIKGKKHRAALKGGGAWKRCRICDVVLPGNSTSSDHEASICHRAQVDSLTLSGRPVPAAEVVNLPYSIHCPFCDIDVAFQLWTWHHFTLSHILRLRFVAYQNALQECSRDKFGVIVVQDQLDFGVVDQVSLPDAPTREKVFHIISRERDVRLLGARMSSSYAISNQVSFAVLIRVPVVLRKGTTCSLNVYFDPRGNLGEYEDWVELVFEDAAGSYFLIARRVLAVVANVADRAFFGPIAPYVPPAPIQEELKPNVIDGEPPPQLAKIAWMHKLFCAGVPISVGYLLKEGTMGRQLRSVHAELLPQAFNVNTYAKHWTVLLWLEEIQAEKDLRAYDQNGVAFSGIKRPYHFLEVLGLAEKRPSVIIGDSIRVRNYGSSGDNWFRGYVHHVEKLQVALVFAISFSSLRGQKYDVRFELNRLTYRRMYQALNDGSQDARLLFPSRFHVVSLRMRKPGLSDMARYTPIDRLVATNPPQWLAVTAIAELKPGSVPFVIFGPPGTGKTMTLIEAIRQILSSDPEARILACAPSNSATDIIAERLARVMGKSELFRMNAPSRPKETLPTALQDYSLKNPEGTFSAPPRGQLQRYRVVVSSCFSASVPHGIGVPQGHFTHIFIDEAGQASEPEVMIPIKLNSGPKTNVIVAGDPKQLAPIVRSPIAERLGLGVSFLDRLMSLPLYGPVVYSGVTVVKLVKNWRSHDAILTFPNVEFYNGHLEPHADPVVVESCMHWRHLPREGFPIIFHAIKGKDQRQASSPSFFNIPEVSAVRDYVRDLKGDKGLRLTDGLIGVISPYNAQCHKIRALLKLQSPGIKVGSVEEFQGQERRVMIISTVRSSTDYVEFDIKHMLGFVGNPRRFNVAVTRAQALLIIVGDPDILGLDPPWRRFLNYVHQNGGWKGRRIPWAQTMTLWMKEDTMCREGVRRRRRWMR